MSPPVSRPIPRFIADASQEGVPYGRWAETLLAEFQRACEPLAAEAAAPLAPEAVRWFPERGWGGRVYLPATARVEGAAGAVEYFGYVSFERPDDGNPREPRAVADFTDVTAEHHPEWNIDLNEEVIGRWRADGGRGGEITLVWGMPLVRGAVAATAEIDGEAVDQAPVQDGRFTLIAVDAVTGFGDELYLEVRLWDRRLSQLAAESLYDEPEPAPDEASRPPQSPDSSAG